MIADNDWKYVVKATPKTEFAEVKTFIKYMNSDYKTKTGEKFKYAFIPRFENGQYYLYGVTTDLIPCDTKNSKIEILCDYTIDMAEIISNSILELDRFILEDRNVFRCSMYFVCSIGLRGKPEEMSDYYCYEWYDLDSGYVFYVGKGTKNRWKQVYNDRRNDDFKEYYNSHNCSCRFVEINLTEADAYLTEQKRIDSLHKIGQAHCNHDGGGRCGATNYGHYNGMYHRTHTDEVKNRLSEINKQCSNRSNNKNAKPVYVYTEDMEFFKEYGCVPYAIEDLFGVDKIKTLQGRIYHSMSKTKRPVNGYYFSREKVS